MNFLAHLHIADHCNSHFMGNLLGDFVKGDPSKLYDSDITNGIKLHRFVDRITDHHPIVEECKPHFKGVARRFAPIALDMFWDHCLAKHWNDFHQESLDDFVEFAFQKVDKDVHEPLPARLCYCINACGGAAGCNLIKISPTSSLHCIGCLSEAREWLT